MTYNVLPACTLLTSFQHLTIGGSGDHGHGVFFGVVLDFCVEVECRVSACVHNIIISYV